MACRTVPLSHSMPLSVLRKSLSRPMSLHELQLMANHALRSIAIKNESVKTNYFISDGRKSKSQARLHFKMKKRGETTPYEKIESRQTSGYRRGNSHNSSFETETYYRYLESLLRSPPLPSDNKMIEDLQESLVFYMVPRRLRTRQDSGYITRRQT